MNMVEKVNLQVVIKDDCGVKQDYMDATAETDVE
jgi:hypothetical protein